MTLDDAARRATDAGYDLDDDASTLLDAIRDETFGHRWHALGDMATALTVDAWRHHHDAVMIADDVPF